MTDIRGIIADQLAGDGQLAGYLAEYHHAPAIFYQKAPSDSRPGWGMQKYPRMDFAVDMHQDPERKAAGTLTVNIWITSECLPVNDMDIDRAMEARLLELVDGTFYTSSTGGTICAEWSRSDEFTFDGNVYTESHPEVYGLSVTFDLLSFPEQITTDPDPILALNRWTKRYFDSMIVIAHDDMPKLWRPSDEHPAIYWRMAELASTDRQSYAVNWYTGRFAGHIIADSVVERNRWAKAIMEQAQLEGEILLLDESPMFMKQIAARTDADPLREGQLQMTGQYGVLTQPRKEPVQEKLNHTIYHLGKKGGVDNGRSSIYGFRVCVQGEGDL